MTSASGRDVGRPFSLRFLLECVQPFIPGRRSYVAIFASAVAASACEALVLVLVTLAATGLASGEDISSLAGMQLGRLELLALSAVLLVARLGLTWVNVRLSARLAASGLAAARRQLLHAFVHSRWERQASQPPGQLFDLLAGRADLVANLISVMSIMVVAGANLALLACLSVVLQPMAVIGLALVGAMMALALRPFNRLTREASRHLMVASEAFIEDVGDLTRNHREVSSFGAAEGFLGVVDRDQAVSTAAYARTRTLTAFLPQVYQTLGMGLAVLGLLVATLIGTDNVAVLGAVVLLLLRAISYGQMLLGSVQTLNERAPYVMSLVETIDDFEAHRRAGGDAVPEAPAPLELRGVAYQYASTPDHRALDRIDLVIERGQMVGVVGPSGGGKSTLLQIIAGLRVPTSGSVMVHGTPLEEVDFAWWREQVALVPQDGSLMTGTVAANIDMFRGLPRAAIEDAAMHAQMEDDIARMGGFDAMLSRHAQGLSGGQLQRLSIARALAGHPELLLLDEPTSALDIGTEERLSAVLHEKRGTISMVIVAHRLSTVSACDRVIVVDGGAIVADGPAGEVLDRFGRTSLADWDLVDGPA